MQPGEAATEIDRIEKMFGLLDDLATTQQVDRDASQTR
jgi:hypothetical protein